MSAAITAMPVCAPLSTSVTLASGPPKSTSAETRVPVAPTGMPASSFTGASTGLLLASSTGASLMAVTMMVSVRLSASDVIVPDRPGSRPVLPPSSMPTVRLTLAVAFACVV